MDKYDQDAFYMGPAQYADYAKKTTAEQKLLLEKLKLTQ